MNKTIQKKMITLWVWGRGELQHQTLLIPAFSGSHKMKGGKKKSTCSNPLISWFNPFKKYNKHFTKKQLGRAYWGIEPFPISSIVKLSLIVHSFVARRMRKMNSICEVCDKKLLYLVESQLVTFRRLHTGFILSKVTLCNLRGEKIRSQVLRNIDRSLHFLNQQHSKNDN